MNLYFLDADDRQHLVARNVEEKDASTIMYSDLEKRRPKFESFYVRTWWDNYFRKWFDYGSHTEFYILQDEDKALNVVAEVQESDKALNVVAEVQESDKDFTVAEEEPFIDDCELCKI